jgi:hypothetical protein
VSLDPCRSTPNCFYWGGAKACGWALANLVLGALDQKVESTLEESRHALRSLRPYARQPQVNSSLDSCCRCRSTRSAKQVTNHQVSSSERHRRPASCFTNFRPRRFATTRHPCSPALPRTTSTDLKQHAHAKCYGALRPAVPILKADPLLFVQARHRV